MSRAPQQWVRRLPRCVRAEKGPLSPFAPPSLGCGTVAWDNLPREVEAESGGSAAEGA